MIKKLHSFLLTAFVLTSLPTPAAQAQVMALPPPGEGVFLSPAFEPVLIKGITVHEDNPFLFEFILDVGDGPRAVPGQAQGPAPTDLQNESTKLIKYFFACLTIPEKDLWVNLSPYEKNRIIPATLAKTGLGRDLLAQDYVLKQLAASLVNPEKDLGKEFWARVYQQAREQYGSDAHVPLNSFNKVWIMANKATVYEHGQTAFVVDGHMKVMMEEDYVALQKSQVASHQSQERNQTPIRGHVQSKITKNVSSSTEIFRNIILPEIEKEVNTGKNFASLRQMYHAQILATWFKKRLKNALLNQVYTDKSVVKGLKYDEGKSWDVGRGLGQPTTYHPPLNLSPDQIYGFYLQAYKKGAFNFIKEELDPVTQESLPRKYFSGGYDPALALTVSTNPNLARTAIGQDDYAIVTVRVDTGKDKASTAEENAGNFMRAQESKVAEEISNGKVDLWSMDDRKRIRELLNMLGDVYWREKFPGIESWVIEKLEQRALDVLYGLLKAEIIELHAFRNELTDQDFKNFIKLYDDSKGVVYNLHDLLVENHIIQPSSGSWTPYYSKPSKNLYQQYLKTPLIIKGRAERIISLYNTYVLTVDSFLRTIPKIRDQLQRNNWYGSIQEDSDGRSFLYIHEDGAGIITHIIINCISGIEYGMTTDYKIVLIFKVLDRNTPSQLALLAKDVSRVLRIAELLVKTSADEAITTEIRTGDNRAVSTEQKVTDGGIDLNSQDMSMVVNKDIQGGVKVSVDPAMIERIKAQGINFLNPVIVKVNPHQDISVLLGLP